MKKITFPLILLVLTACGENKEVQPAEEATAVAVAENVTDSIQVDAITSATSKPNQVSFNGTMVIPPQRMATVSLTMGGVIKSTSLLPGEPVRQGSVLATLEHIWTVMHRLNFWKRNTFASKLFLPNRQPPKRNFSKARQITFQ